MHTLTGLGPLTFDLEAFGLHHRAVFSAAFQRNEKALSSSHSATQTTKVNTFLGGSGVIFYLFLIDLVFGHC